MSLGKLFKGSKSLAVKKLKQNGSGERVARPRSGGDAQLRQVKEKLRKLDDYRDVDDDELDGYARELIDKEEIKVHFSRLLQDDITDAIQEVSGDVEAFPDGQIEHTIEHQAARARALERFASVAHFPVKLLLYPASEGGMNGGTASSRTGTSLASMMRTAYGPLHAALVVDDVRIEWDASSLIVPEMVDSLEDGGHVLQTEVRGQRGLGGRVMESGTEIGATLGREMDFSRQVDLMLAMNTEKGALIDKLVDVIVRYNKVYYYHPIVRNSQHFVVEAMAALEISDPPQFQGRFGEYYDYLRQRRTREFATHADLDTHVKDNLDGVTSQEDLEYLHCLYFQFHLQAGMREAEDWVCPEDSCKMGELAERIQRLSRSLLIEQFLPGVTMAADGGSHQ